MKSKRNLNQFVVWQKRTVLAVGCSAVLALSVYTNIALAVEASTSRVMGREPVILGDFTVKNDSRPGQAPAVGDTLSMDYTFYDEDGDAENFSSMVNGVTTREWRKFKPGEGGGVTLGNDPTYTVTEADAGWHIEPIKSPATDETITDPYVGGPRYGDPVLVAESNQPTAIQIHNSAGLLTGRPIVGEELTVQLICPTTCDPTLAFTWKVDGVEVGTGTTYTPAKDDQKKSITVGTPSVIK